MTDEPDKLIETGLVGLLSPGASEGPAMTSSQADHGTAAVPLPVPVPVAVTAPVTPVEPPADMDVPKALELIHAVAHNLYDLDFVLKHFNLKREEYDALLANEWFKNAIEVETKKWNSANNANTRLAIETALALETALPALTKRMKAPTEPLQSVVALAKLFAEIAGSVGNVQKQDAGPQAKFKIVFNLGADVQSFDKVRPMVQIGGDGDPLSLPVPRSEPPTS